MMQEGRRGSWIDVASRVQPEPWLGLWLRIGLDGGAHAWTDVLAVLWKMMMMMMLMLRQKREWGHPNWRTLLTQS